MNSDKAKGKTNEIAGRIERKVGQLTGSKKTQVKGALRQAKGELQQAKGEVKERVNAAAQRLREKADSAATPRTTTRTKTTRTTTTVRTRPAGR